MNFLVWWNPATWLSDVGENVIGALEKAVRTLFFSLDSLIYRFIIDLYNIFESLCNGRLLSGTLMSKIASRIGVILGTVMFFYVIISFVNILIDPDKLNDKEVGAVSIIKRVLITIVLLGVSNYAFNMLYVVQSSIVRNNVIGKLLLPYKIDDEDKLPNGRGRFGSIFSEELFANFYMLKEFDEDSTFSGSDDEAKYFACTNQIVAFRNQIINTYEFDLGYNCLNESVTVLYDGATDEQETFLVSFNWLFSALCGGLVAYMLAMYCIKVGVRMVQLSVLEIISPMAFISYISPKSKMFENWRKIYFATYIDVFVRIAIINFTFFLIATVFDSSASDDFVFWKTVGEPQNLYTRGFYVVIIVLALLTFAKKAPDLIKQLLPESASKLGFGLSMKDIVGLQRGINTVAAAAVAAPIGIIGGFAGGRGFSRITGAFGGAFSGLFRGAHSGFGSDRLGKALSTARDNQAKANLARAERIGEGASYGELVDDSVRDFFGVQRANVSYNQELAMSNQVKTTLEGDDIIKHIREVRQSYLQNLPEGAAADPKKLAAYDRAEKEAMRQMYAFAHDHSSGETYIHIDDSMLDAEGLDLNLNLTEEYKPNVGIHTQIRRNERRARRRLSTYDDKAVKFYNKDGHATRTIAASGANWKSDNNAIKNAMAGTTGKGK